jgi:hypothetical protein
LGQAETEIFLQKGLDKPFRKTRSDLPVRQNQHDPVQQITPGDPSAARMAPCGIGYHARDCLGAIQHVACATDKKQQ